MIESISAWVAETATTIRERHAVNPYVFIALSVACGPVFYYSLYRLVRALARDRAAVGRWSLIFLIATAVPYLYVMVFGRNMPWWVYVVMAAAIGSGVRQLIVKLRTAQPPESPE